MFHKVKSVTPLEDRILSVQFSEGVTKEYDVKPLFQRFEVFRNLQDENVFNCVHVDQGGYGVIFNDEIDISCDELYNNGIIVKTPFDNIMAFSDATQIWGLNESTLRKAIKYGKLKNGVDVCKYGKQWVVSIDAMIREYGLPKEK